MTRYGSNEVFLKERECLCACPFTNYSTEIFFEGKIV